MHILLLLLLFNTVDSYTFALVPKTVDNPFFQLAHRGCVDHAELLKNVTCLYGGVSETEDNQNPDPDGVLQVSYVQELLDTNAVDGLAISVKNASLMRPVIDRAIESGIPVITFDSDDAESKRQVYIGTDNYFLGETLAQTAKQISPEGGTYAIVLPDVSPNIRDREDGFRKEMSEPAIWSELPESPIVYDRDLAMALEYMDSLAEKNLTVLMLAVGGPLFPDEYDSFYKRHRHRNITIVSADDFPVQIEYLSRGYVQGLVGQMPYEMGYLTAKVLYNLKTGITSPDIIGTNLITHIQVPLVLPELNVDNHLIGDLCIIGYTLFGLIAGTALICGAWTCKYRKMTVVKVAQPIFLVLVAAGVVIMGASIIPLSLDDNGEPISEHRGIRICMSVPWLSCCGFCVAFSALFSKTIRINRIVEEARELHRVKVTATDVLAPFTVLLTLNIIVLLLWSFIDPLKYYRFANAGLDGWNRVISTYGACRSDNPWYFLGPLAVINLGVLVTANWQAYKARNIKSEFAEPKYIGIAMISLLQALLTGIPIVFVVRKTPEAYYLVMSFMIFAVCMALLLLIFVPKMMTAHEYSSRSIVEQQRMMLDRIHALPKSTPSGSQVRGSSGSIAKGVELPREEPF